MEREKGNLPPFTNTKPRHELICWPKEESGNQSSFVPKKKKKTSSPPYLHLLRRISPPSSHPSFPLVAPPPHYPPKKKKKAKRKEKMKLPSTSFSPFFPWKEKGQMTRRLHDAPAPPRVVPGERIGSSRLLQQHGEKKREKDAGNGSKETDSEAGRSPGWSHGETACEWTAYRYHQQHRSCWLPTPSVAAALLLLFILLILSYWPIWWAFSGAPPTMSPRASVSPRESSGVGPLRSWYRDLNKHIHTHRGGDDKCPLCPEEEKKKKK